MKIFKRVSVVFLCLILAIGMTACKNSSETFSGSDYELVTSEYYIEEEVNADGESDDKNDDKSAGTKDSSKNNSDKNNSNETNGNAVSNPNRVQINGDSTTIDESKFKNKHLKLMLKIDPTTDKSDIVKGYMNGLETWMKKYNCTYEFVDSDLYNQKLIASIAAKDAPDLFYQIESFPNVASLGIVQPLEDYIPKNQKYLSQKSLNEGTWAGHIYSLFVTEGVSRTFMKYNPDLFLERGVKTPKEYYNDNEWNWDTFRKTAKAMTGNGIYGVQPHQFAQFGGKDIIKVAENGKISSILNNSWNTEFLQWVHKLYVEDKVFRPVDDTSKVAMSVVQLDAEPKYDSKGNPTAYMKADGAYWEIVPFPKKPGDSSYVSHSQQFSFMVPVGARNPAMSVSLALSMCAGWKAYVDGYNEKYCAYEKKVRKSCENATPILYYPDVHTTLPNNFVRMGGGTDVFCDLLTEPTSTALASVLPVHQKECKTYNEKY